MSVRDSPSGRAATGAAGGAHAAAGLGVGGGIGLHQAGLVDAGVDLGGREGGVAEELLDGAEVAAGLEEVGGERVAEGVGGRGRGQAELHPRRRDDLLDVARVERAAAGAAEERGGGVGREGREGAVVLDGGAGDGQDGDEALAAALAADAEHVARAARRPRGGASASEMRRPQP